MTRCVVKNTRVSEYAMAEKLDRKERGAWRSGLGELDLLWAFVEITMLVWIGKVERVETAGCRAKWLIQRMGREHEGLKGEMC